MAATDDENNRSVSTTYEWRKVKLRGPARTGQRGSAGGQRWAGLHRRDARSRITLTLMHRGGAESWWVVEARGRSAAVPGHRCLDDVMAEINRTYGDPGIPGS